MMKCLMCDTQLATNDDDNWVHAADGSYWCPGKTASVATPEEGTE